jgi:hypothetical protein
MRKSTSPPQPAPSPCPKCGRHRHRPPGFLDYKSGECFDCKRHRPHGARPSASRKFIRVTPATAQAGTVVPREHRGWSHRGRSPPPRRYSSDNGPGCGRPPSPRMPGNELPRPTAPSRATWCWHETPECTTSSLFHEITITEWRADARWRAGTSNDMSGQKMGYGGRAGVLGTTRSRAVNDSPHLSPALLARPITWECETRTPIDPSGTADYAGPWGLPVRQNRRDEAPRPLGPCRDIAPRARPYGSRGPSHGYRSRKQMPEPTGVVGRTPYWTDAAIGPWIERQKARRKHKGQA